MDTPRNARFWTFIHGSYVKLTLTPGQELEHWSSSAHEEGWSSEETTWRHSGDVVERYWRSAGSDCDGRTSRTGADECAVGKMRTGFDAKEAGYTDMDVRMPVWGETQPIVCFDAFAEAAGC